MKIRLSFQSYRVVVDYAEGNHPAEPITTVVFPLLSLKKSQVNYLNSRGRKAANLGEGQLCKWRLIVTFSPATIQMNIQLGMEGWKWSLSTVWTTLHSYTLTAVFHVMPGGWEGGPLITFWDVIRQMHTIARMAVIYTTLGIVRYLLLLKYSCFISGTENVMSSNEWPQRP